jgi:hypothetical protein
MRIVKRNGKLKIIPSELKRGVEVEQEHAKTFGGDQEIIKIIKKMVMDHLKKDPLYYQQIVLAVRNSERMDRKRGGRKAKLEREEKEDEEDEEKDKENNKEEKKEEEEED